MRDEIVSSFGEEGEETEELLNEQSFNPLTEIASIATEIVRGNPYRQAAIQAKDFFKRSAMEILSFGPQTIEFECWVFACGWTDLLPGIKTATDLAKKWNCTDANIGKIVNRIQSHLDIPPMPGQRCDEARKKFSDVRKGQLQKT